jgi:hypothetical protein
MPSVKIKSPLETKQVYSILFKVQKKKKFKRVLPFNMIHWQGYPKTPSKEGGEIPTGPDLDDIETVTRHKLRKIYK